MQSVSDSGDVSKWRATMQKGGVQPVREQLGRIARSEGFASSPRLCRFLQFIVEQKLAGQGDDLKETLIGVHVFDRDPGYDTKSDAIVRVEARRLRAKLQEYYEGPGLADAVRISLPKGAYVPEFTVIEAAPLPVSLPAGDSNPGASATHAATTFRFRPAISVAGAVIALLAIVMAASRYGRWPHPETQPTMRPFTALAGLEENPSFSPDDRMVAYIGDGPDGTSTDVFIRAINDDEATVFVRTPEAGERGTAWSPDGTRLAFLRDRPDGRMHVVVKPLAGGPERILGDVASAGGTLATIDWSPDDRYLVASDHASPGQPLRIVRFWLRDGRREWLTSPPTGSLGDSCPAISPDGRTLAFRRARADNIEDVYVQPLRDEGASDVEPRRLTREGRSTRGHDWTPEGDALIVSLQRGDTSRRLWKVPLDGGEVTSLMPSSLSAVQPAVAHKSHRLLWVANFEDMNIWAVPATGGTASLRIASTYFDMAPEYSPDGNRIAFRSNRTGISSIWVCDRQGQNLQRLVDFGGAQVSAPRWSPDGKQIVFEARVQGSSDLYLIPAAGGSPVVFANSSAQEVLPYWAADGKSIYYAADHSGDWQLWQQRLDGGNPVRLTENGGFAPRQSADGAWLYYTRGPKQNGLYRMPATGGKEELVLASLESALWGNWGITGNLLYFIEALDPATSFRAAIIEQHLERSKRREIHRLAKLPARFDTGFAVSPDGKELLYAQLDRSGADLFLIDGFR
jgi:Tol biopolymer transport system component